MRRPAWTRWRSIPTLASALAEEGKWSKETFMRKWIELWSDYTDYFDHATKTTLANLQRGVDPCEAASNSSELAGPARVAPLISFLAENPNPKS